MKSKNLYCVYLLLLSLFTLSCTEQYALQSDTFESALVVEATITNELKRQQIKISRTYRLEENRPTFETGAEVYLTDNIGNTYLFEESSGVYLSTIEFKANSGNSYRLTIVTKDGKTYVSANETLTTVNDMQSVTPIVKNKNGERGVEITINSFDPSNSSKYYRYEYEETYKIIAPEWDDEKAILTQIKPGQAQGILVTPRTEETRTCFTTKKSDVIILANTNGLNEDRLNFPLRFISNKNYIITHRYSILVRQYIQNLAAHAFYKTLKKQSGSESILSQNQPGFIYGNIKSVENPNEKVIGFFEVSSISVKRIFFNYVDLFPGEPLPPYFTDCTIKEFKNCFDQNIDPECKGAALNSVIGSGDLVYVDSNFSQLYFYMVSPPCGDCTRFSSNIIPDFWID